MDIFKEEDKKNIEAIRSSNSRKAPPPPKQTTLESEHCQFQRQYEQKLGRIDEIKAELAKLDKEAGEQQWYLDQRKQRLQAEYDQLNDLNGLLDYYLTNGQIIDQYYQIPLKPTKKMSILEAFESKQRGDKKVDKSLSPTSRSQLLNQYLSNTDPHYLKEIERSDSDDVCQSCNVRREMVSNDYLVCPNCGSQVIADMVSERPIYKEGDVPHNMYENKYVPYQRMQHFKGHLMRIQARETTRVPQEVYDVILLEFKRERRSNLNELNDQLIRRYLNKYVHLKYNKYNKNSYQIIAHLTGNPPLYIPADREEELSAMFTKIEKSFEKHCPPDRSNFISYPYIIYRSCQLLGYDEYLPYFNLAKSVERLNEQNKMWKLICKDMNWEYMHL